MINSSFFDTLYGIEENKIQKTKKENIIYDNSFVKDMINLCSCKSLISIESYLANRLNDISKLSFDIEYKMKKKNNEMRRINKLVSLEGNTPIEGLLRLYVHMVAGLVKLWHKILAFFAGLSKKIRLFISQVVVKHYVKFYEKFDPKKFTNLDAEVKNVWRFGKIDLYKIFSQNEFIVGGIRKLMERINNATENTINNEIDDIKSEYIRENSINLMEEFYKLVFNGNTTPPEIQTLTVKEFFPDAVAGKTPNFLKILNSDFANDWIKIMKGEEKNMKIINKGIKEIEKNYKKLNNSSNVNGSEIESEKNKSQVALFVAHLANKCFKFDQDLFMFYVKLAGMVYKAAKKGLGEPISEQESKEIGVEN